MTTPAKMASLYEYLMACRDVLRLQGWDLYVEPTPLPDDNDAVLAVTTDLRRHWAKFEVGSFFKDDDGTGAIMNEKERRLAVAHEFVHLMQAEQNEFFARGLWLEIDLSVRDRNIIEHTIRAAMEYTADLASRVIEPMLPPMPDFNHG